MNSLARRDGEIERQLEEEDRNRGGNVAEEDVARGRRDARELGREQIDVSSLMYHARYLARGREEHDRSKGCSPPLELPRVRYRPAITRRVDLVERYHVTRVVALLS